jgi:hypothetical protein
MTRTFSTSAKPLPFYADGEAPLEKLVDKFGSRLEQLDNRSKFLLLSSMAFYAAVDSDQYTLDDAYCDFPGRVNGREILMTSDLQDMLEPLGTLRADNLLGLCEALISQLRYTREVQ